MPSNHPTIWTYMLGSGRTIRQSKPTGPEKPQRIFAKPAKTNSNTRTSGNKPNVAGFTASQDAKLKQFKEDGKTWRQIADGLGKNVGEVKARFKELNGAKPSNNPGSTAATSRNGIEKGGQTQGNKSKAKKGRNTSGEKVVEEDDNFTFEELQILAEILQTDQRDVWLRVCSAFFDRTGRRLHPDDVEEKFSP